MIQGSIDDANFASLNQTAETAGKDITAGVNSAASQITDELEEVKEQIKDSMVTLDNTLSTLNTKTVEALADIASAINALNKED